MRNTKWLRKYHATHPRRPVFTNEEVMQILGITGKVPCPYCSKEGWAFYHSEGFPCTNVVTNLRKVIKYIYL